MNFKSKYEEENFIAGNQYGLTGKLPTGWHLVKVRGKNGVVMYELRKIKGLITQLNKNLV